MSEKKFIAGWLLIPAAITWLAPVIFASAAYQAFIKLNVVWPTALGWIYLMPAVFPLVWIVLLFCGSLGLVYLLVRHSRLYPRLSTVFALLFVGSLIAVASMNAVIFKDFLDRDDVLIMLGLSVASLSWWAYMKNSDRVRATFAATIRNA